MASLALQLLDGAFSLLYGARDRLLNRPRNAPERVDFPRAVGNPPRHVVTIEVSKEDCLTKREQKLLHIYCRGVRHWWLRHREYGFAAIDLPRGDRPFCRTVSLPPGRYTLGVGRAACQRRIQFEITSDGLLNRQPPRTEAHAEDP